MSNDKEAKDFQLEELEKPLTELEMKETTGGESSPAPGLHVQVLDGTIIVRNSSSRLPIRTKWLAGLLAATLLLTIYTPVSMAADPQKAQTNDAASTVSTPTTGTTSSQRYSDIPDHAWYSEAVTEWIARGILSPQPGDEFKSQFVTTRGEFAFLLAYSLGLAPSAKSDAFTDLPDGELAGYIDALQEAGLAKGYPDGTFRPSLPVTRAEAASWIAAAKKLTLEPQVVSPFRDVKPTSWYAGAVNALASTGIVSGKTKDRFVPGDVITRAESINLLYRSFYKASIIQDIQENGTIIIDGHAYRAGDSVKGIFKSSNKAILLNAAIQFIHNGDTIVAVGNLIIGYKAALAGQNESFVFNAEGNTINGMVTVDADQVTLANLKVMGDLILTQAFQTKFFAYNVLVGGETVYLGDAGRPKSQIANLEFQKSDLGKLVLANSTNLKQVHVVPDQVSKSSRNPKDEVRVLTNFGALFCQGDCSVVPIPSGSTPPPGLYVHVIDGLLNIANPSGFQNFSAGQFGYTPSFTQPPIILPSNPGIQFTPPPVFKSPVPPTPTSPPTSPMIINCDDVSCNVDAFVNSRIDTSTTGSIGTVTVHSGAQLEYVGGQTIDTLILGDSNATGGATFIGSTNIGHVTVNGNGSAQVVLNVQGTIGTLEMTGNSQLVLPGNITINNLIVPPGVDPKSLFANPSDLSKVSAINGQPTAPITTSSPVVPNQPSTEVQVPVPTQLAQSVAFTDTDQTIGISGILTWDAASTETNISSYEVYFLDPSDTKLGSVIASVYTGSASSYSVEITNQLSIPVGATQFGVYSKNAGGESKIAAKVAIVNVSTQLPNGVDSLTVVQHEGELSVTLKFTDTDAVAQGVTYYKLFITIGPNTSPNYQEVNVASAGEEIDINLNQIFEIDSLINGAEVSFTIVAVNSNGDSIPTSADKATVVWVVPPLE